MLKSGGITRIAKLSGVSPATVSRTFNGHPYVTSAVRQKIYAAAHRAGYVPPEYAGKRIVAVVLHDFSSSLPFNGYRSDLIYELAKSCERHSLRMEMFLSSELGLLEEQFIKAAIVFQSFLHSSQVQKMPYTRFICINGEFPGCASVNSDNRQGIQLAFEKLYNTGHRRIGLVLPGPAVSAKQRLSAFQEFCDQYHLPCGESMFVYLMDHPVESIGNFIRSVSPDALLIGGEDMQLPVNYALSILGVNVPRDLSVISYENSTVSKYMVPPHTTVAQNFSLLAETAVTLAKDVIEKERDISDEVFLFDNRLIERNSVMSPISFPNESGKEGLFFQKKPLS